jgi:hypothetical protein
MTEEPVAKAAAIMLGATLPSSKELDFYQDVLPLERAAIKARREHIRGQGRRDRTTCARTGVALSGGGIRSASFALGALQALDARAGIEGVDSGIEGVDYLSTVSGGGYIGCALTAATQKNGGRFPFTNEKGTFEDPPAVRHIRDYSNYLMPRGFLDAVTAFGLIGRGLVANVLVVAPVVLFFVSLTLLIHRDVTRLQEPTILFWNIVDLARPVSPVAAGWLHSLPGFWVTVSLVVVNIVFLAMWVFVKSVSVSWTGRKLDARISQSSLAKAYMRWRPRNPLGRIVKAFFPAAGSAELNGGLVLVSKLLFFATALSFWFELQPYILRAMVDFSMRAETAKEVGTLEAFFSAAVTVVAPYIPSVLAALGAAVAFFSKNLGQVIAAAAQVAGWKAWLGKIAAQAALWFAAIVIPLFLWYVYLVLAFLGLSHPEFSYFASSAACPLVRSHVATPAALLASAAFLITLVGAWFINPNATSLHRLYRDRLSKAFLFRPDEKEHDDRDDLRAYEPELHEIDTRLCPYPIINTALNIQGSRHANKRGRNADFFDFTPKAIGSEATGYVTTEMLAESDAAPDLGSAMAISGAAVSSNMGAQTVRPLAFTLALLNLRLGFWLRNPKVAASEPAWYLRFLSWLVDRPIVFLFREMFSQIDENSPIVYLTDGGHVENLGIYALMKRRCKVIIAIDGEADRQMRFPSLLALERFARIDLGATMSLPWEPIRDHARKIDKAFEQAEADGTRVPCELGPHCAAAEIRFSRNDEETAILLYVKASVSGDEDDYILDYKRRHPAFPHETTNDQFFGEEQLEVYRALGFHIMKGLLTGSEPFAVLPGEKETEDRARQRLLDKVRMALLGAPPVPPGEAPPTSGGRSR